MPEIKFVLAVHTDKDRLDRTRYLLTELRHLRKSLGIWCRMGATGQRWKALDAIRGIQDELRRLEEMP